MGLPIFYADVCPFTDVRKSLPGSYIDPADPNYADHYVAVCAVWGIKVGKTATTFAPYDIITRQQLIRSELLLAPALRKSEPKRTHIRGADHKTQLRPDELEAHLLVEAHGPRAAAPRVAAAGAGLVGRVDVARAGVRRSGHVQTEPPSLSGDGHRLVDELSPNAPAPELGPHVHLVDHAELSSGVQGETLGKGQDSDSGAGIVLGQESQKSSRARLGPQIPRYISVELVTIDPGEILSLVSQLGEQLLDEGKHGAYVVLLGGLDPHGGPALTAVSPSGDASPGLAAVNENISGISGMPAGSR